MKNKVNNKGVSSSVVFKSGLWYTLSTFLFRSVALLTTPIIVRILTREEYGYFNNIQSWVGILVIFIACSLQSTIIRAKIDYEEELDSYSFSMLSLQSFIATVVFLFIYIFRYQVSAITDIDIKYFFIIYVYIIFSRIYAVFITNERAQYKYKLYSMTTGLMIVFYCLFTVFLVLVMSNKMDAIIYGNYIPYIIVGAFMLILIVKKGKKIKFEHFKYGLALGIPLVPHVLSLMLLNSSDRIMITKMVGASFTALYSLSSVIPNIVSILLNALVEAWSPWFMDMMKLEEKKEIKRIASIYYVIFSVIVIGTLLFAPEILYILGGKKYLVGRDLIPPLVIGCMFQFVYSMYVQVEFYKKKMKMISIATLVAAIVNVSLNFFLIPIWGYKVAAYTTLASYIVLFLMHYMAVRKMGYSNIFNRKIFFIGLIVSLFLIPISVYLYYNTLYRIILIAVYILVASFILYKNRKMIIKILLKK